MSSKLKRFKFRVRHCADLEPMEMIITAESLGSAAYRIIKTMGWTIEEISEEEYRTSGGKDG